MAMILFLTVCTLAVLSTVNSGLSPPRNISSVAGNSGSSAASSVESSGSSDSMNNADDSVKILATTYGQLDQSHVSSANPLVTIAAIETGLNPETTLIPTDFYCYFKEQQDLDKPAVTLRVKNRSLTILTAEKKMSATFRPGREEGDILIKEGSGETHEGYLKFTSFGQELSFGEMVCYQRGASHESLQHRFLLNTPDTGTFNCNTSVASAKNTSVELLPNKQYNVSGKTGSYEYTFAAFDNSSAIGFVSGPLMGAQADYYEDPDSGTQALVFEESSRRQYFGAATSSRSTTAFCTRQSEPRPYKLYGVDKAPQPIAPKQALQGLYLIDESELSGMSRSDAAQYIEFDSSGYLRIGMPIEGGTDCTLTQPSGMPLCSQYDFDGKTISLTRPWGKVYSLPVSYARDDTLERVGEFKVELAAPVDPADVIGTWDSQEVSSGGIAYCAAGFCSGSIQDRLFRFKKDGTYLFSSGGESYSSGNLDSVSTYANSSDSDQSSGTYRVDGNRIELVDNGGRRTVLPIVLTKRGWLAVGEIQYRPE